MPVALGLVLALACAATPPKVGPARSTPTVVELRELVLRTRATPQQAAIHKRIRVAHPKGWTGEREPDGHSIRLFGPHGKMLIAAALHPDGLGPFLAELKAAHPAAAPSPPEAMSIPGIRPELGERATRFVITGKEVGEMVLIERNAAIVLFVTVVDPNAWPEISKDMERCYPTVEIVDVPDGAK